MTNIFVGNLSYDTTQDQLHNAFAAYGAVEKVNIINDRDSGQPRGFAFVEMSDAQQAADAINALNGAELNGRAMNVNEARPKPAGGGFGNRGGGGGYGGGRGGSGGGGGRGGNRGGFGGGRNRW
jgi:RNA recognition motif-containing protein